MMKSKQYKEEEDEANKSAQAQEQSGKKKEDLKSDIASGSCFSSEQEKEFQKNRTGKLDTLTNAFSKSFTPPTTNKGGKWRDLQVRTIWTIIMLVAFILILSMGHFYCAILVLLVILCIYKELTDIPVFRERNNVVKNYYLITWYILLVGTYYFYIAMVKDKISYLSDYPIINIFLNYHNFICFLLYIIGFFIFIRSLTKGYYRYQFRQFAYIHIILLIFGVCSSLIISNIFSGLVWFLIPASLVITNDITAYIWGRMFGKHQLTALSPKKTWEGFIGAFFSTLMISYLLSQIVLKYNFLLCPVHHVNFKPFEIFSMKCDNELLMRSYELSYNLFGAKISFTVRNLHIHVFFCAMFASLCAPLGGLFASGFKRAIKIKDFADTIPGHGGLTDRMDCQLLMGLFTYVYLSQFVFYNEKVIVNNIIKNLSYLNNQDKAYVYEYLKNILGK